MLHSLCKCILNYGIVEHVLSEVLFFFIGIINVRTVLFPCYENNIYFLLCLLFVPVFWKVVVYVLVAVLAVTWIVAIIQCCHICCHHKCLWRPHQVHTDAEDTLHEPPSRPPVVKSRLLKYGASSVVYQGSYSGRMAAIKIVHTHVPLVWENESQILSKTMAHDNVVEFVDAFRLESSYSMEMIIITNYYPLGSLYVHLSHNVLKWSTGLNAMCSFMRGLEYLHSSSPNKPSIAHCDIKSSNILVKDQELTCCICDFGIARRLDVLGKSTIKQVRVWHVVRVCRLHLHIGIYSVSI